MHSLGFWVIFVENVVAMSDIERIQLFENKKVRTAWDEGKQEWFFSIVDVCGILTDQPTHERARNYWKVLKNRLVKEGSEVVTKCNRLKLIEPIKVWIAQVAAERINQAIDPERSID